VLDEGIVDLYWQRNEQAIKESNTKYGSYCFSVANHILSSREDSEECVNDTWLNAWKAIPPQRPNKLSAFFAKITRNLSINRYKSKMTEKRGKNEVAIALEELEECIASSSNVEAVLLQNELNDSISQFLYTLSKRDCNIFIRRYFYVQSIEEIAALYRLNESNVLVNLSRTRKKLRSHLQKEGYLV
jgi:RNA polymerase sigma-70 factor (ECF subfamily)